MLKSSEIRVASFGVSWCAARSHGHADGAGAEMASAAALCHHTRLQHSPQTCTSQISAAAAAAPIPMPLLTRASPPHLSQREEMSKAEQLKDLAELKKQGLLDSGEFAQAKRDVMQGGVAPAAVAVEMPVATPMVQAPGVLEMNGGGGGGSDNASYQRAVYVSTIGDGWGDLGVDYVSEDPQCCEYSDCAPDCECCDCWSCDNRSELEKDLDKRTYRDPEMLIYLREIHSERGQPQGGGCVIA